MAIDLTVQYPTKVGAATAQFPYGVPRNITTPGDGTGTPWEAALVKDNEGYKQSLLKSASIVPSGTPDEVGASQYMQAIVELASGRAFTYDAGGTANAVTLVARTNQLAIASYFDGLSLQFTAIATNTAAMTVNVAGLGIKSIVDINGTALLAGDVVSGNDYQLFYNSINFVLIDSGGRKLVSPPESFAPVLTNNAWQTISITTLANAGAKSARIRVRLITDVTSTKTIAIARAYIRKIGSALPLDITTLFLENVELRSSAIYGTQGIGETIVELDGSQDFELYLSCSDGVQVVEGALLEYYK